MIANVCSISIDMAAAVPSQIHKARDAQSNVIIVSGKSSCTSACEYSPKADYPSFL